MTDLQLGLLVIGGIAVVGVFAFNRVQERRARQGVQQAFASKHADTLLDEPAPARESHTHKQNTPPSGLLPDERVDYIMLLRAPVAIPGGAVLESWRPIEARFGRRVLLAGSDGSGWGRIEAGRPGSFNALHASLQLVSRAGVVSDAELIEFRADVETAATRLGASVAAPEMRT